MSINQILFFPKSYVKRLKEGRLIYCFQSQHTVQSAPRQRSFPGTRWSPEPSARRPPPRGVTRGARIAEERREPKGPPPHPGET